MSHSFADGTASLSDSLMLGIEAQRVISLRLAAIARGGPTVEAETRLMVTEKMVAALQAAGMLALCPPAFQMGSGARDY